MLQKRFIFFTIALSLQLTAFTVKCGAQTLDGFMGFEWHDEMEADKAIASHLPGARYDPSKSKEDILVFDNVTWEGVRTSSVLLVYCPEGLFSAFACFKPKSNDCMQLFHRLQKILIKKYGKYSGNTITFEHPYKEGDGKEFEAFASGKAVAECHWEFEDGNHGTLIVTKVGLIDLVLSNGEMVNKYTPSE